MLSNLANIKFSGKLKTLKIKEGKAKDNKGKIEFVKSPEYSVLKYDQKGNINELQLYKNKDTLIKTTKYYYNDKNNTIADSSFDAKKKLTASTEYKYDANGYIIEELTYNASKKIIEHKKYINNVRNKVSELKCYDTDEKPLDKYSYYYNINGNIVEKSHFLANGLDYRLQVLYNDKGIKDIENYFNINGEISRKVEYYSRDKSNEAITCTYGEKDMIDKVCYHKYTYDKEGNPVRDILLISDSFGKKPEIHKMKEIEIEYY